ncbi:FMN-dependent NADH-azoreductase [Paenibacillus psychroresistens]|uniref:FMN dependent NADH:quinone oxidoreductase n=1 Tax=Paenibacillus psychroresistens TaxID=1778678 RepID=A0A6B8RGF1_9BACL|nr:FMN-dependent NADH-azoreductase [Paenibacillus psychroresistens]QGQ94603.1 FMN-dependent NADH-azoreductase [Paenibacillus psychroresistens]
MSSILFVKANNRPVEYAVSVKLYEAFLENYKEAHPDDDIVELDLYQEHLPYLDTNLISGAFKLGRGMGLTAEEKLITDIATRFIDQFLAADKIIIGFPLWNLTVPAVLHTYLDYLNRAGTTFKYTPQGAVGLVLGKKVALLNARGGNYSEGDAAASEMAVNLVVKNLNLFGITDITKIIAEGHGKSPDQRERIIGDAIQLAAQTAKVF